MFLLLLFSLIWGVCLTIAPDKELKAGHVILMLGALVLYWGFSYVNAPDTDGYMEYFDMISVNGWVLDSLYTTAAGKMEPGTFILMQLCKRISGSYYFFQFVILALDVVLSYIGLKKMTDSRSQSVVFFLLFAKKGLTL